MMMRRRCHGRRPAERAERGVEEAAGVVVVVVCVVVAVGGGGWQGAREV